MRRSLCSLSAAFIFIALFSSAVLQAQNTSPYWSLAGNSNASATTSKLGTTNNIPLRFFTNNAERLRLDGAGKVAIGATTAIGKLTLRNAGGTPNSDFVGAGSPLFTAFSEGAVGNGDFIVNMASNTSNARPVMFFRRARGTLVTPTAVSNNDFIGSLLAAGHDGTKFQSPATIDFYVDGTPSSGNVPARISFVTGTNISNRTERLVIKSNGNVGIGTASPSNKLHVVGRGLFSDGLSAESGGIYSSYATGNGVEGYGNTSYGIGTLGSGYYGLYGSGTYGVYASGSSYGVYAGSTSGIGVYGNSSSNYGVFGISTGAAGIYGTSTNSYGMYAYSANNYGIYGYSNYNIGGYFYCPTGNGLWAKTSSTAAGVYAGVFEGNVYASGAYLTSDKKLKKDVKEFTDALSLIGKLKPRHYAFIHEGKYASLALPQGTHYGFLAQDIEEVLPGLVDESVHPLDAPAPPQPGGAAVSAATSETVSIKAINYIELIPIMVKAMQEQQAEIEVLKAEIAKLKGNSTSTSLSSATLGLVTPNPVRGAASIQYAVPEGSYSQLIVTDAAGKQIKSVRLSRSGVLNLDVSNLASGVYHYSLVIDNKKVHTEKMTVVR